MSSWERRAHGPMGALLLASLLAIVTPLPAAAQEVHEFSVSVSDPASAIRTFGLQAGIQILASADDLKGKKLNPVSGEISTEDGLKSLLAGTGLGHQYVGERAVALVNDAPPAVPPSPTPPLAQVQSTAPTRQPARARVSNAEKALDEGSQLSEIVVTATKRESTVQNTPISITAVSGVELQERGLVSLSELAQSVPGLAMRTSGPGQAEFEMRGMASTGGNSATVGFYLDDVPLSAPASAQSGKVVIDPNLYDLSRIEVLRGPQGTLYGSGSMGGTIKVVTNAPNPQAFDTSGEAVLGGTDGGGFNHAENAMLNIPLATDTAALRIVASHSSTSGWIDRTVIANGDFPLETNNNGVSDPTGAVRGNVLAAPVAANYRNVNNEDLTAVRSTLLWTPTDRLTFTGSYFYQQIHQDGGYEDSDPGTNAHYQPFDSPEPTSDYFNLGALTARYRFDAFDLTSTTARYTRNVTYHQDGAEEWQWALALPSYYTSSGGIGAFIPAPVEYDDSKQTSEEVRLTSSGNTRFKWLFGYFYSDFTSYQENYYFAPGGATLFGTSNIGSFVVPTTLIQTSVFSELSYQLTSKMTATVGARRYLYNEWVKLTDSGVAGTGSDAVSITRTSERNQGLNPKFSLSYAPIDDLLLYSTIAKGFRPGGGTGPVPTTGVLGATCEANLQAVYGTSAFVSGPNSYAPDHVWNYEIGEKLRAFDSRLTVNSAVYFEKWSDIQQSIPLACGYNYTANAGEAHVYGAEIEIQGVLAKGLILSANVGYTHANIASSNVLGVGIDPGTPIQEIPDWTSSVSLAYRRNLHGALAFTARAENDYVASRTDATYSINHLPSYDLTSLRTGVEAQQWSAVLFVNNLFNKNSPLNDITQISVNLPTYNRVVTTQPLTFGIDLNYRFGR
jgi:iron complex outermembrane receptor protein